MENQNCLITGGTSGLGKELVKTFLQNNYIVYIIGKNRNKFNLLLKELPEKFIKKVFFFNIDLSEIKNISNNIVELKKININVLINNAGAIYLKKELNSKNLEKTFVINYLSHFYLTTQLIKNFSATDKKIIVNITSSAHHFSLLDIEKPITNNRYNGWITYFNTKLMNILFTYKCNSTYENAKSIAVHPGWVKSNFGNNNNSKLRNLLSYLRLFFAKNPKYVAQEIYKIIDYKNINKEDCFYSINKKIKSSKKSYNIILQNMLWEKSKKILENEKLF